MRAMVMPKGLGRCGERVANTPIFFFNIGNVILALNVDLELNALDSFSVLVLRWNLNMIHMCENSSSPSNASGEMLVFNFKDDLDMCIWQDREGG
jgi:hypothetical protein